MKKSVDQTISIPIKNTGNTKTSLKFEVTNIPFAVLESDSLELNAGEEKNIDLKILTSEDTEPGVYTGRILITSPEINKTINLIVEVETKRFLFDVIMEIPNQYRELQPGKSIVAQIQVKKFGDFPQVDVIAKYKVKDLENKVLLENTETFAVENETSFIKEIYIPTHFKEGDYVVITEVHFQDTVTTSSQLIHVKGESVQPAVPVQTDLLIYIIIGVIVVVVGLVVYTHRKVRKVEKKYRKTASKQYSKYEEKKESERKGELLRKIKRRRGK